MEPFTELQYKHLLKIQKEKYQKLLKEYNDLRKLNKMLFQSVDLLANKQPKNITSKEYKPVLN